MYGISPIFLRGKLCTQKASITFFKAVIDVSIIRLILKLLSDVKKYPYENTMRFTNSFSIHGLSNTK